MILDATTRKLEIVLAGAVTTNQLNVAAEWVDMTDTATTGGATVANTNGTTAVTIVAAPAASTQRRVLGLSIYNADTVDATVTVRYNDNSTLYPLVRMTLASGSTLEWSDTAGWHVVTGAAVLTPIESLGIACSDETTALTTGVAKVTFRMPYAFTLTGVRATCTTAPTGATLTVDINESGSSILSTKLTIDASEKTSTTAATPAVLSDTSLADDAEITIDIDQVGSTIAGTGLKVWLIGRRTT